MAPLAPFRQFIVKIHSRCNLACEYCYVYTMADQRWRGRPGSMARETVDQTARRIAEHVRGHSVSGPEVIFHGGEPLLAGPDRLRLAVTRIRGALNGIADPRFSILTNGVLLNGEFLRFFDELDVAIGVSIDGDQPDHDRTRRHRDGTGSHADVVRALAALTDGPHSRLFGGLLCTIDLRSDPIGTYEELLRFRPPRIDFLLPHGNWSNPPPGRVPGSTATPYAEWLMPVFDRWYGASRQETGIRLFEELIHVLLGGASAVEGVGLSPACMIVVETDGAIEQSDMLTSAYHGAGSTGLHVSRDSFDAALSHPGMVTRQLGAAALSRTCRSCRWWRTCGGGLYPHRYKDGTGFANPSVYCPDLYRLIDHIQETLAKDVASLIAR